MYTGREEREWKNDLLLAVFVLEHPLVVLLGIRNRRFDGWMGGTHN